MAKINARDWVFQVHDGASTWLDITELNNWDNDPTTDEEVTDGTVFASNGIWEGDVLQRGDQIELTGFYDRDPVTGVRAAGQDRLETLGRAVGVAGRGQMRFRHIVQTEWTVWPSCLVSLLTRGGGNNAFTGWGVRVHRRTAATTAPVV